MSTRPELESLLASVASLQAADPKHAQIANAIRALSDECLVDLVRLVLENSVWFDRTAEQLARIAR